MKNKLTNNDICYRKKMHLKNLKRKYARLMQQGDCIEECIELKADIDYLEKEYKKKCSYF